MGEQNLQKNAMYEGILARLLHLSESRYFIAFVVFVYQTRDDIYMPPLLQTAEECMTSELYNLRELYL